MQTNKITFDRIVLDSLSEENIKNLRKVAKYIVTVPQKNFNMLHFRSTHEDEDSCLHHKCNTIGCIIGHATILFPFDKIPKHHSGDIDFNEFSEIVFGIESDKEEWKFLFDSRWSDSDNSPEGASRRILYFLKHGLPVNWFEQMAYGAPLSY